MQMAHIFTSKTTIMNKKSYFFVALVAASIFTIYFYFCYENFNIQSIVFNEYISKDVLVRAKKYREQNIKTILLWNSLFSDKNFYFGDLSTAFRNCPVDKCEIVNDRDYLHVADYDAILFHGNSLERNDMPRNRSAKQFYVYVNLESPSNRPYDYYEDYFNLTMTYRQDSDIPWTYFIIEDAQSGKFVAPSKNPDWKVPRNTSVEEAVNEVPEISNVVRSKSKLVTWFVSNCQAKSGRLEYVEELSKHIGVDIYGKCGTSNCDREQKCFSDVVEPNYFFYLSFENSFCDDYVTEKVMNPLRYNIVPVVYGGANYSQFIPPNSYVNALDFDSPKELATYLKYLSRDLSRYQSFLQWKKYYRVNGGTKRAVCTLCEVLHKQKEPKMYLTLSDWYEKEKCPIQTLLQRTNDRYATKRTLTNRN
ncbi:alpha-(1,3)-fucosyltransferase C-like isoform X2 [Pseudomyrmex gracilis]|uniref:alpha-(1,3)-fucosyltransferase C-like isoform X2 n=1 Tax=Pseudomyrmex gracilis TaxID=219809 RepID=UPI0009950B33|nr:alpha-(1,3)-fucosyltransferase C-like isoform X2 [Pseudomyrmex gracilis]